MKETFKIIFLTALITFGLAIATGLFMYTLVWIFHFLPFPN